MFESESTMTVKLMGGLGNQLFQLAALYTLSKRHRRSPVIDLNILTPSPHSSLSYMDTVFSRWRPLVARGTDYHVVEETSRRSVDNKLSARLPKGRPVALIGYFQDIHYVDPEFIHTLAFSDESLARHPDIGDRVFLHVRGGDYVGHPIHHVALDSYYERAIALFPGRRFALFTNDLPYALQRPWLDGISYEVIQENEVDELFLMSKCAAGICANSTFSWWGGYLAPNRNIVLPDRWANTNNEYFEGLYFPGSVRVGV
jgi:Glycosyl transferase family 11